MTKSDFDKLYNLELAKSLSEPNQRLGQLPISINPDELFAQLLIRNLINNLNNHGDFIRTVRYDTSAHYSNSANSAITFNLELAICNNDSL